VSALDLLVNYRSLVEWVGEHKGADLGPDLELALELFGQGHVDRTGLAKRLGDEADVGWMRNVLDLDGTGD
jgi:hypothetical protein